MGVSQARLIVLDFGDIDGNGRLSDAFPDGAWHGAVSVLDPLAERWPLDQPGHFTARVRAVAESVGGPAVPAIVGHCTNATLALEVAAALVGAGTPVGRVVLLAPSRAGRVLIAEQAVRLCARLGASQQTLQTVHGWLAEAASITEPLARVFAEMDRLARDQARDLELDPEEAQVFATEIQDRYHRWLGYLSAQLERPAMAPGCPVDVLADDPAAVSAVTLGFAGFTVRLHHCPDPFGFTDPGVRRQLADLLAEHLPTAGVGR
jgi:hypothetical protein